MSDILKGLIQISRPDTRLDIHTPSDAYLAGYLNENLEVPEISLECVMKAAGLIEQMIHKNLKPRKDEEE